MSHITTEQALQIPQQLKRQGSHSDSDTAGHPHTSSVKGNRDPKFLSDDAVTLRHFQSQQALKSIEVESYKSELGQDTAFVKETLRNKLAEYNLNPNTRLTVSKDVFGNIELKGAVLQTDIEQISEDLNNSNVFKNAFEKVSKQQPTLNYVDNVVKISRAYGVGNPLFNSIVSEESEFNKLNDLAHRYETLKTNNELTSNDNNLSSGDRFQLVLN